ncbi:MAG: DUF4864 domain-containing protein [Chthoniobacterales bacterium]
MSRLAKAVLVLFFISLCGMAFFVTARVRERTPIPLPHELFAAVNDQLAAFRADDFSSAYRQASTGVQHKFTLPQFEAMIRREYSEMASATRVEFGSSRMEDNTAVVQVFFFTGNSSVRVFLFSLIAEDGGWKVGGVEETGRSRPRPHVAGRYV